MKRAMLLLILVVGVTLQLLLVMERTRQLSYFKAGKEGQGLAVEKARVLPSGRAAVARKAPADPKASFIPNPEKQAHPRSSCLK